MEFQRVTSPSLTFNQSRVKVVYVEVSHIALAWVGQIANVVHTKPVVNPTITNAIRELITKPFTTYVLKHTLDLVPTAESVRLMACKTACILASVRLVRFHHVGDFQGWFGSA